MITVNPKKCPQDHACPMIPICPQKAISQIRVELPIVDLDKCVGCGVCIRHCPRDAFEEVK